MSKSQRLRLGDLRSIYRLIGECRELGADPVAWRLHLLDGLCRRVGADVGIGGETGGLSSRSVPAPPVDVGWGETERKAFLDYLAAGHMFTDPMMRALAALPRRTLSTHSCRQMLDKHRWHNSEHFNKYHRPVGVDDGIVSLQEIQVGDLSAENRIVLRRTLGARPFEQRERRIVHWFHHELAALIGRQLASASEPTAAGLAPRLQKTLQCLLEGDTEKQVASRLGLTRQTTHQYVKTIYRHFDVHSRAALAARWQRYDRGVRW